MIVSIVELGELLPYVAKTDKKVVEVHVITDDGSVFLISQEGEHGINVRTRDGNFVVEPIAMNSVTIRTRPN